MRFEFYKELEYFSSEELTKAIIKLRLDLTLLRRLLILARRERYFTLQCEADALSELSLKALSEDKVGLYIKHSAEAERFRKTASEYYRKCLLEESI